MSDTPPDRRPLPFAAVLAHAADVLPGCYRDQYLCPPDANFRVRLIGSMDSVWLRRRWLGPFFRLLGSKQILFSQTGTDVPTTLDVTSTNNPPRYAWTRTFRFPNGRTRVLSGRFWHHHEHRRVMEQMGTCGLLHIAWTTTFEPPDTMRLVSAHNALKLGPLLIPIPRLLAFDSTVIQRVSGDTTATVDVVVSNRLLGPVFGYRGTFTIERLA